MHLPRGEVADDWLAVRNVWYRLIVRLLCAGALLGARTAHASDVLV